MLYGSYLPKFRSILLIFMVEEFHVPKTETCLIGYTVHPSLHVKVEALFVLDMETFCPYLRLIIFGLRRSSTFPLHSLLYLEYGDYSFASRKYHPSIMLFRAESFCSGKALPMVIIGADPLE